MHCSIFCKVTDVARLALIYGGGPKGNGAGSKGLLNKINFFSQNSYGTFLKQLFSKLD